MSNAKLSPTRIRELAVFRYRNALERGDFDTVAAVLKIAENDPMLWAMIDDLSAVDEGVPERPAAPPTRLPRNDKHITQVITIHHPSTNGQTPEPDHSQEENDMMTLTVETFIPERPRTLYPFTMRFITLVAALFVVILIGGLLIEMVSDPIDGYPALVSLQTEEPGCAVETNDPQAESIRLAGVAQGLSRDLPPEEHFSLKMLLATCALQAAYSPKADDALQQAMIGLGIVPEFPGHNGEVDGAVFSPAGDKLLIAGDRGLKLWDIATHSEVSTFPPGASSRIYHAVFSPDGQEILALTEDGIFVWDTDTGATLAQDFETGTYVSRLSYSPDGVHAAFGMVDGSVQIWNLTTATLEQSYPVQPAPISGLAFSPDGKELLVGGNRTPFEVYLVNLETGEQQAFTGLRDFSNDVAFSPDGQYVLAGGDSSDRRGVLWDTKTGETVHIFSNAINDINTVAFSPDGQYVLLGSADSTARLYDVDSGDEVRRFPQNPSFIASVAFSPDGKTVLIGSNGKSVRLWPTTIEDTIALACANITRDFTPEERAEYGLGDGAACPA